MSDRFSEVQAETFVASTCFKTGPPRAVGIELEWLLHDQKSPARPLTPRDVSVATAAGARLSSGRLTVEPGGQLELSSDPFADPLACMRAVRADLPVLRAALSAEGLALSGVGLDPSRPPRRVLELPRYVAMERFFDRDGPAGRTMMCSTAAVQINVDAGVERAAPSPADPPAASSGGVDVRTRWALLHELVPVLVAAFANSPVADGRDTGLRAARHAVWQGIDPARTRPAREPEGAAAVHRPDDEDPREQWVRYVMTAPVLCIPAEGPDWSAPAGLRFVDWVRGQGPRPATAADLEYHLTTLFPPVRPRGHLELRVVDAQRTDADAAAALALVWALCTDPAAADGARAALAPVPPTEAVLARAVRDAAADPELTTAAKGCFDAALGSLDRLGIGGLRPELESFRARYVERGRCPADDTRDEWHAADAGPANAGPATWTEAGCATPAAI